MSQEAEKGPRRRSICVTLCGVSLTSSLCKVWAARTQHSFVCGRGWKLHFTGSQPQGAHIPILLGVDGRGGVEVITAPLHQQRPELPLSAHVRFEGSGHSQEPPASVLFPDIPDFVVSQYHQWLSLTLVLPGLLKVL